MFLLDSQRSTSFQNRLTVAYIEAKSFTLMFFNRESTCLMNMKFLPCSKIVVEF